MHSYVPYFWRLTIVSRTILDQNHLGGWSVPRQPTHGGQTQLSPNIWPIVLSFEDIHKKVIFSVGCHTNFCWINLQEPKYKNPTLVPKGGNWAWPLWVGCRGTDHPPRWFRSRMVLETIINRQRYMTFECYTIIPAWIELEFIKNLCGAKLGKSLFCEYLQN